MYLKKAISEKAWKNKKTFFAGILKTTDEKIRIRIRNKVYGSKEPDPDQNITDPDHCSPHCTRGH
jgi:hypothetical protein